jgi:hypothetical protein
MSKKQRTRARTTSLAGPLSLRTRTLGMSASPRPSLTIDAKRENAGRTWSLEADLSAATRFDSAFAPGLVAGSSSGSRGSSRKQAFKRPSLRCTESFKRMPT